MRGCLGSLFLMLCCAIGGAVAINVDPNLPGQAVAAGASSVGWVTGALSRLDEHPTPRSAAPLEPSPNTGPITLITPTPATPAAATPSSTSSPAFVLAWTQPDRVWARTTLQWDLSLDTAAESTYPQFRTYYAGWAADWQTALGDIAALEAGIAPSSAERSDPPAWFATAIADHQADAQAHPGNAGWDDTWVKSYQRLISLWTAL